MKSASLDATLDAGYVYVTLDLTNIPWLLVYNKYMQLFSEASTSLSPQGCHDRWLGTCQLFIFTTSFYHLVHGNLANVISIRWLTIGGRPEKEHYLCPCINTTI